jgi:FAD:protein FMN transferase
LKIAILLILFFWCSQNGYPQKYTFSRPKMGSPFTITISAKDSFGLHKIIDECYLIVDDLNKVFSDYDMKSEASKINNARPYISIPVSIAMIEILELSKKAYEESEGNFDVTIGKLTKLWRRSKATGLSPDSSHVKEIRTNVGLHNLKWKNKKRLVFKENENVSLDFGGIAKGYIADKVGEFLRTKKRSRFLIDAGGDLVAGDAPLGYDHWEIGIESLDTLRPYPSVPIKNQSIATSGSTYQNLVLDGKYYSHIIHPKSGMGISSSKNVTVIAKKGSTSDWLATACSIITDTKKLTKIANQNKATIIISTKDKTLTLGQKFKINQN